MQPDRFDDLARALAQDMPRRRVLRAIGATAGLFSLFGFGKQVTQAAPAADSAFLPMIAGSGGSCPPARVCGDRCCPEGMQCAGNACVAVLAGTWTGSVSHAGQSIGIRFVIQQNGDDLNGRMLLQDPESNEYLETGTLVGLVIGSRAAWETETESYAEGSIAGDSFNGIFDFPARAGESGFEATLSLQRSV